MQKWKSELITFELEKHVKFFNLSEITKFITDPVNANISFYFKALKTNEKATDSIIYFQKGNDLLAIFLQIPTDSKILMCLQMKKDIDVVMDKKAEIIKKWTEKKAEIAKEFPGAKYFLFIVTKLGSSEHKMNNPFGNDIYFIFSDKEKENTIFNLL